MKRKSRVKEQPISAKVVEHIQEQGPELEKEPQLNLDTDEISSDSDEDHIDNESYKNKFLSLGHSQDLKTQLNLCMKCKKKGDLLVCSSVTCLVSVHESCIKITPDRRKFLCPFCACSVAISVYSKAKKEASLARKKASLAKKQVTIAKIDLTAFIGSKSERSNQKRKRLDNELEPPCGEKEADMNLESHNLEKTVGGQKGKEKEQLEGHGQKLRKCKHVESSVNRNEKTTTCKYVTRLRDKKNPCTSTASPKRRQKKVRENKAERETCQFLLRRKKLAWTKIEEDTFKEGMKKFASELDGRIPWTKIMEFGGPVFKGRSTIDLKDKWRNINKKE